MVSWRRASHARTAADSPVILHRRGVARSFNALWNERALAASIVATLRRVLIGFGLAIAVGVPLGLSLDPGVC